MSEYNFHLEPCPFCGEEATYEIHDDHHGDYVDSWGCKTKNCEGNHTYSAIPIEEFPRVLESWNQRTGETK